jgi:hypothetical protein
MTSRSHRAKRCTTSVLTSGSDTAKRRVAWCVRESLLRYKCMRRSALVGALAAGVALAALAPRAGACVLEPTVLHRSDASLARIDTAAPEPPVVVAAAAYRRSGLTCGQDVCVANNCGDLGGVGIEIAAPRDDQTPANRMGYRLELVSGVVPEELEPLLGVALAGPAPLRLHLGFEEVPEVDATLRMIAIDAAGNESQPSAAFALTYDGCTLAAVGNQCEQDYDADGEYAARHAQPEEPASELAVALDPVAPVFVSQGGCSLPLSHASGSVLGGLLPLALGWLAARRRR